MPETTEKHAPGLRERKKQRTRWALVDAALDLFLTKGYEVTTVDDIVAVADVSQRTFFRYFATKEDAALAVMSEYDDRYLAELAVRPSDEPPVAALYAALDTVLASLAEPTEEQDRRFRKLYRLLDASPALAAGRLCRYAETERAVTAMIARRAGVDPATDRRPHLIVASFTAVMRVVFDGCSDFDENVPAAEIVAAIRATLALARVTLAGAWSIPPTP